jgi:hypothetical protein
LREAARADWQDAADWRTLACHTTHEDRDMPIRISSLTQRIAKNGAVLHQAMMDRGADHEPSEAEQALLEERRLLKEERAKRQAQAQQPRATAAEKLVRTHHPQAKDKPKATKEPKEPKAAKAGKARPSRAEKQAAKSSALDAARRSAKKSAKT